MTKRFFILTVLLLIILGLIFSGKYHRVQAQSPDGSWSDFENISDTPTSSTYPCIVTDPQGYVHVLWSEDVGGKTRSIQLNPDGTPMLDPRGNPINYLHDIGNTLYYTRWDGEDWTNPVDVQVNPDGNIQYPRAVADNEGNLHVVWVSTIAASAKVMYSRVPADKAEISHDWSQPLVLVERTFTDLYPVDIVKDSQDGLHVFYSQLGENPGAYAINSSDGGNTWSDPVQVYITQDPNGGEEGVSNVGLVIDAKDRLHATWTRYDSSGNGKAIYYSQSTDLGKTWSRPFEVAEWQPGWYETDWLSTGVVGNEVHLIWEGGKIAYLNERISTDGGLIWGENQRILPNLVGENGYANLVVDSAGKLHLLVVKRGSVADAVHGIWYATWEENQWADPQLLGARNLLLYWKMNSYAQNDATRQSLTDLLRGTFTGNGLRYQMSGIVNGNQLFVVVVNEWDGDIWSSHTTLDAPFISPRLLPQSPVLQDLQVTPTQTEVPVAPTPTLRLQPDVPVQDVRIQPTDILLVGILPALIIVAVIIFSIYFYKRS